MPCKVSLWDMRCHMPRRRILQCNIEDRGGQRDPLQNKSKRFKTLAIEGRTTNVVGELLFKFYRKSDACYSG